MQSILVETQFRNYTKALRIAIGYFWADYHNSYHVIYNLYNPILN